MNKIAPLQVEEVDVSRLGASPAHKEMFERQLASSEPHEADFHAYKLFRNKKCTVFDIGANFGSSALSLNVVQPTWEVISFEPNPALVPYLEDVAKIFAAQKRSFSFHNVGLGNSAGTLEFYIPRIENWNVVGEASFDRDHFDNPKVRQRLASYSRTGGWRLLRVRLPVVRFDDFEPVKKRLAVLQPDEGLFVKMDVEGFEESVLGSMMFFLKTYRPTLMIENDPTDNVPELLKSIGYSIFAYSATQHHLSRQAERGGSLNLFYIHQSILASGAMVGAISG
jgi:FkbM family methyltransferase